MSADQRLEELGVELPPAPKPMGVYKPIVICGNMAYLSGHGPLKVDKTLITGRLGLDMDVEAGYEAARTTGLAMLATLQSELGSLNRVKRLVKLLGLVRSTDNFGEQIRGRSYKFGDPVIREGTGKWILSQFYIYVSSELNLLNL